MNTARNPVQHGKDGFSLVEIFVVIAIIAVLITLLLSVSSSFIEKSKTVKCAGQLRQISQLLNSYLGDHNQRIRFTRDGSGSHLWYNELKEHSGISDEDARQLFRCPSLSMQGILPEKDGWYCYGFRLDYSQPTYLDLARVYRENGEGVYELYVTRIESPAAFYIMADTVEKSSRRQTMRMMPRDGGIYNGSEGIHLRHQARANILFLDGHVESLDSQGLHKTINILQAFDANLNIIDTQL